MGMFMLNMSPSINEGGGGFGLLCVDAKNRNVRNIFPTATA